MQDVLYDFSTRSPYSTVIKLISHSSERERCSDLLFLSMSRSKARLPEEVSEVAHLSLSQNRGSRSDILVFGRVESYLTS